MYGRSILLLAAALAAAMLLAVPGCGGGGNSDSSASSSNAGGSSSAGGSASAEQEGEDTTAGAGGEEATNTSSLTKAQFLKQANKICLGGEKQMTAELEKALAGGGQAEQQQALVRATHEVVLPQVQSQIDELRALGLPSGDEQQVEAILASMQEAVETAEGRSNGTIRDLGPVFERAGAMARQYGINGCGFA